MNNKGTTLVELMIYMIVALIVTTAAFRVISTAVVGYGHGRAVSKAQFNARDGMNVISRDIASMGYKMYFYDYYTSTDPDPANRTKDSLVVASDLFGLTNKEFVVGDALINGIERWQLPDSNAAFFFTDGGNTDSDKLEFFRITVGDNGEKTGRERIIYSLDEDKKEIVRELFVFDSTRYAPALNEFADWLVPGGNPDTTIIATNVVALNFRFSRVGDNEANSWTSLFNMPPANIRRDDGRHIEIAILTKAHRESKGQYGAASYLVGDRTYTTPTEDQKLAHRLYRQSVEVPNNATGLE